MISFGMGPVRLFKKVRSLFQALVAGLTFLILPQEETPPIIDIPPSHVGTLLGIVREVGFSCWRCIISQDHPKVLARPPKRSKKRASQ